ncbi:MAG: nucleotide-binding domain containing protein [Gemmobacter sp.]|nr:nucleotide-binding domain containing protein [Gemmobacter sp.]
MDLPSISGPAVILAGSCAQRTRDQLFCFARSAPVLQLDLMADPVALTAQALDFVSGQDGTPCAIATSAPPETVEKLHARFGREGTSARADAVFAALAPALVASGIRRILVAGGETSGTVIRALNITRLQVGPYGGPGIGSAVTLGRDPLALCLKSGKLGPVDMLAGALDAMAQGAHVRAK